MRRALPVALAVLALVSFNRWVRPWAEQYASRPSKRSTVRVFVDLDARVYYCEWSEFCSRAKHIEAMDVCRAKRHGNEPAVNQTCSADCQIPIDASWFPKEAALEREGK